jgi:prepilin-type N-terminal cleavage/methylation domain-containing protein
LQVPGLFKRLSIRTFFQKKPELKGLPMGNLFYKARGFTLIELMVVIVIVGILAAVAIPKFFESANKAKASEFPTQLSAIYTGQVAYLAEKGYYLSSFAYLRDSAGVDISSSSRWFTYSMATAGTTAFTGLASVNAPGFGNTTSTDFATINQTNSKSATTALQRYCPNWK